MKRNLWAYLAALLIAATASQANAETKRISIQLDGDEYFSGDEIALKRLIQNETDGVFQLNKYRLESVKMLAKSEDGCSRRARQKRR